jgi:hypothetical protein
MDERIHKYYKDTREKFYECRFQYNENARYHFIHWMNRNYNVKQIKVLAVRYLGEMARGITKSEYIEIIWDFYNDNYDILHTMYGIPDVYTLPIPRTIGNPENRAQEQQTRLLGPEILEWVIDRNPSSPPPTTPPTTPPTRLNTDTPPGAPQRVNHIRYFYGPGMYWNITQRTTNLEEAVQELLFNETNLTIWEDDFPQQQTFHIKVNPQLKTENFECGICYDIKTKKTLLECNHHYCIDCMKNMIDKNKSVIKMTTLCCAFCRNPINNFTVKKQEDLEHFRDSCIIKVD